MALLQDLLIDLKMLDRMLVKVSYNRSEGEWVFSR